MARVMSIDALRWAFSQQGITASQKLVLLAIADRADGDNLAFPSREQLVFDTCLNKETISAATEVLTKIGLIKKIRRFNGSTVYELLGVPNRDCHPSQSAGNPASRKSGSTVSRKSGSKSAGNAAIDEPEIRLLTPIEPTTEPKSVCATRFDATALNPPSGINRAAWADWVDYRKTKRKPISLRAAEQQWRVLSGLSPPQQAECIASSIANDYQGLFPEKFRGTHGTDRPSGHSSADRSAAGRVRANVAAARAQRAAATSGGDSLAADGIDVRDTMDVKFRRHG